MSGSHLHPPVSPPRITRDPLIPGEDLINAGGVVTLLKTGDTPQCRRMYRIYLAEHRALQGQPLSDQERETRALIATFRRVNWPLVDAATGKPL